MMESNIQRAFQRLLKAVLNPSARHLVPIRKTVVTDATASRAGQNQTKACIWRLEADSA